MNFPGSRKDKGFDQVDLHLNKYLWIEALRDLFHVRIGKVPDRTFRLRTRELIAERVEAVLVVHEHDEPIIVRRSNLDSHVRLVLHVQWAMVPEDDVLARHFGCRNGGTIRRAHASTLKSFAKSLRVI
jgi:hypothetical protein